MAPLIVALIILIMNGLLPFMDNLLNGLVDTVFSPETHMSGVLDTGTLTTGIHLFQQIGISLIVLKFLKKGFDIYILWIDGDADADPFGLVVRFVKALAISLSFTTLYSWVVTIISDLIDKIEIAFNISHNTTNFDNYVQGLQTMGITTAIIGLISLILFLVLYVQFLIRGLELLILRIGLPLACIGLLDSDNGVFKTYMQKFYQCAITVLVQLVLAKFSLAFLFNAHPFWGLASMSLAMKTPKFLAEFMILGHSGGGIGGAMNNFYHGGRVVNMGKGAVKALKGLGSK